MASLLAVAEAKAGGGGFDLAGRPDELQPVLFELCQFARNNLARSRQLILALIRQRADDEELGEPYVGCLLFLAVAGGGGDQFAHQLPGADDAIIVEAA